jgi:H/ACA ribonucleoprotein complex subunit 1
MHNFYFIFQLFVDPNKLLPLARFLPRPPGTKPAGGGGRGGRGGGGGRGMILATI